MAVNPYGTWGAPVNRHKDTDIQSGTGKMGDTLLYQNVNKSVIEGQWCDPIIGNLLQAPNSKSGPISRSYTALAVHQTVGALVGLVKAVFL